MNIDRCTVVTIVDPYGNNCIIHNTKMLKSHFVSVCALHRLTPEKDNGAGIRARPSAKQKPEQIPDERSRRDVQEKPMEEDPKKKQSKTSSRKWWILLIILIVLAFAVVYNFEHLPKIQQFNALLENSTASPENIKQQ